MFWSKIDRKYKITNTNIDNNIYNKKDFLWWDKSNKDVYGLHKMNTIRLDYILSNIIDKNNLMIADIGCGGGILSEAIIKNLPPSSTLHGIDISEESIKTAQAHANSNLKIKYKVGSAYKTNLQYNSYDIVIMSDVLEHLDDLPGAILEVSKLLKTDGLFIFDTFNRTFKSWFFGIFMAQNILGLLPPRTHDWSLFIQPQELNDVIKDNNMVLLNIQGFRIDISLFDIIKFYLFCYIPNMIFTFCANNDIQYFGCAIKKNNS
jgi:2-polyprenyl-6-hydroxyphenyl methylase / 3-demethylubiquinone-9 3-methyltransferase